MGEKLLLVVVALLTSTFLVVAIVNQDSDKLSGQTTRLLDDQDDDEAAEVEDLEDVEEQNVPITGDSLERASKVALDYIGQGRVTDTEVGDEEGYYEIEVTLNNGREADVHLDEKFNVLSVEYG